MELESAVRTDTPVERTAPGEGEGRYLTTVYTHYLQGARNYRVLFGRPVRSAFKSREGETRGAVKFAPGARFALDLWKKNAYGTLQWRCLVCEAIGPGEEGVWIPRVSPAARVLLQTQGAAQSRLVLAWLRELEADGVDLLTCPPETFEAAQFRLLGSRADRTPPRRLSGRL